MNRTDDGQTIDVWHLKDTPSGKYLLETNYDHWESAPKFDDRREPAMDCLDDLAQSPRGFNGFEDLYNVLSAKPNLNRLTTYTTLMHPRTGELEAYRQFCQGLDCPLW